MGLRETISDWDMSLPGEKPVAKDQGGLTTAHKLQGTGAHEGYDRAVDLCPIYFGTGDSISSHVSPMSVTAGGASVVVPPNSTMRFRSSSNTSA